MTTPKRKKGFYNIGGVDLPSVTTVMPGGPPGAWYAKMAGECAVYHQNAWMGLQEEKYHHYQERKRNPLSKEDATKRADEDARLYISNHARRYGTYTADVGSAVHHLIETDGEGDISEWLDGKMNEWCDDREANEAHIRKHFHQYREFCADHPHTVLHKELLVFSESNHAYAGTLDCIAEFEDGLVLIDYKTGTPKVDFSGRLYWSIEKQLNAYAHAERFIKDGKGHDMPRCVRGMVVELRPDEWALRDVEWSDEAFAAFLCNVQDFMAERSRP